MAGKTNVMRILEKKKILYTAYEYASDNMIDGSAVAKMIGKDPGTVYKTLISKGRSASFYVFVLPSDKELCLKKAAAAAGEKNIELLPVKQIESVTGYIKGGCSPVGMKKAYTTFFHSDAKKLNKIIFSAGKPGFQVEISPCDITKAVKANFADICQ